MHWLTDALTERDGKTFDLKRIAAASLIVGYHANATYAVFWMHQAFSFQDYATGAGLMIAGLGAALGFAAKSEAPVAS